MAMCKLNNVLRIKKLLLYVMRPAGRMEILMGLLKCGLNNNLELDLSMNYGKTGTKGQRHKGTK